MSEVSRQKVEYISHDANITRGKSKYVELVYKRLDGQNPGQISKTGAFITQLDNESKNLIKAGGVFVITKTKTGDYWNLTKVEDVSTYVENSQSNTSKGYSSGGGQKSYQSKAASSTYNTAGIKVGAVLHDAVALAGVGSTTAKVKTIAEELLKLSYELEANVNSGKYEPKSVEKVKTEIVKEVVDDSSEELDKIEF